MWLEICVHVAWRCNNPSRGIYSHVEVIDRQTDRYFIDRKKVNPDLFVIEIEICTCIYNIGNLLKSYDNIHSMTYIKNKNYG